MCFNQSDDEYLCSKQLKLDLRQNVNLTPLDLVAVVGPSGRMA